MLYPSAYDLPVPVGWADILTLMFGDYMTPVVDHVHNAIFDPDVPYTEYFENLSKYRDKMELGIDLEAFK